MQPGIRTTSARSLPYEVTYPSDHQNHNCNYNWWEEKMKDLIDSAAEFLKALLNVVILGETDDNTTEHDEKASD